MSKQVKVRPQRWADGEMPSKAERRQLGKIAAAKRATARRRKRLLKNVGTGAAVLLIILGIAALAGAFDRSSPPNTAASTPSAVVLDPALSTKPTVTKGTGELTEMKLTTLIEGTGQPVQAGMNLAVNYVGVFYTTGQEFDSSWSRHQPFSFVIGDSSVIKGWDQGLIGVKVGSRVQLDIPASLAYGDNPTDGRPAGPLRFVIDVMDAA